MATVTDLIRLTLPATGEQVNTWGETLNDNLERLEEAIAEQVTVATTGGTTALTETELRASLIKVTGTLVSNATLEVSTRKKWWIVWNATSGAFTLTLKESGSTGVVIPQGSKVIVFHDGTESYFVDPSSAALSAIGALTPAANKLPYYTSASAAALADLTAFARTILDDADAAAVRTTLGLGGLAVLSAVGASEITDGGVGTNELAADAVTNAKLADAAAWTLKMRNAGSSGDPSDAALADVTEETAPAAGDYALGWLASAEIRKFDISKIGTGQQTVNLLTQGMVSRVTSGATAFSTEKAANDVMVRGYEFPNSGTTAIQIGFPLPKNFLNTAGLVFKFYWTTSLTAGTGTVVWQARGRYMRNDDPIDGSWGTAVEVSDAFLADGDEHISAESSAMTPGGTFAAECWLQIELFRDAGHASDNYDQTAVLKAAMMHYTTSANTDD